MVESLGGLDFSMEDFQDLEDGGIATVEATGKVGESSVSQTMYQLIRLREGRAVWWHFFRTREEVEARA